MNTPQYLYQPNDPRVRQLDFMTPNERDVEHTQFKHSFGDYITKGWFETTNRPAEEEWPPSTEDWDRYAFFADDDCVARCAAYCDECAREFATIIEERMKIEEVEVFRVSRINRRGHSTPENELPTTVRGVAFTINRRGNDGLEIPYEDWEPHLIVVADKLKEHGFPDVMDKWKVWHDGAYYIGEPGEVDRITDMLCNEMPDMGMSVYAGFPHEFYMTPGDPKENVRKYIDIGPEEDNAAPA